MLGRTGIALSLSERLGFVFLISPNFPEKNRRARTKILELRYHHFGVGFNTSASAPSDSVPVSGYPVSKTL